MKELVRKSTKGLVICLLVASITILSCGLYLKFRNKRGWYLVPFIFRDKSSLYYEERSWLNNDIIYYIMFDRFSSSGDFNRLVSSRRYDIHRSVWRFNRMCIFDYIIDQIRIQEKRQIAEGPTWTFCFFFSRKLHIILWSKLNIKDVKGGIYYGYFSTCSSISFISDCNRCCYDDTVYESESIKVVYEKVHENSKWSFQLFNRGRFSLAERRKVLHGLSLSFIFIFSGRGWQKSMLNWYCEKSPVGKFEKKHW